MAINYGDIILINDEVSFVNGDFAFGEAKEQQAGAVVRANAGSFRLSPTMCANTTLLLDAPQLNNDSRELTSAISEALRIDGWELISLSLESVEDLAEITILQANKTTDSTAGLI